MQGWILRAPAARAIVWKQGCSVTRRSACLPAMRNVWPIRFSWQSRVLMAMRVDAESARAAIRISLGGDTPEADIDSLLVALGQQVKWLQNASQAAGW